MVTNTRRLAAVLSAAVVMAVGAAGVSMADNWNSYCGHGITYNTVHRSVVYERYNNTPGGAHNHQYKHDVNNWPDHHPWKTCG